MCCFLNSLPGHTVFKQRGLAKGKVKCIWLVMVHRADVVEPVAVRFELNYVASNSHRVASTPGVVSGMECTKSPTLNTAGEKSSIGAGRAAAAVKIK